MQHSHIMAKKTKEHWTVLWIDQKQSQAIPPAWFIQLKEQKKKKKDRSGVHYWNKKEGLH